MAGQAREHHQITRTGPTIRVPLLAQGNLPLPNIHLQQEAQPLLHSQAWWSMGPRGMMRMKLGVSAGSSRPLRSLPLWSEPDAAVRRKSVGWRRRGVQPAPRS